MSDYKKEVIVDSMSMEKILRILADEGKFLQHKIEENKKKYTVLLQFS